MNHTTAELLEKGLSAQRESKYVEFKRDFDPGSKKSWCGLVKEIVALTNTKGGVVVIGVDNTGTPVGTDVSDARAVTPEKFTDKIKSYAGVEFADFELLECEKNGEELLAIVVGRSAIPLVFERPGTYQIDEKRQGTAFSRGTVYFRHGGKSEPATREDLRGVIERRLATVREEWLGGIRRVVEAEPGSAIVAVPREAMEKEGQATPIRISDDPNAPVMQHRSSDEVYPYRQTEVIEKTNKALSAGAAINQYDVQAVRAVHGIDDNSSFAHEPKFGSQQYSPRFVQWMLEQYESDETFFDNARSDYYKIRYGS